MPRAPRRSWSTRPAELEAGRVTALTRDAAEPDVARGRVLGLALPRRRPVTVAVVRRAEVGAALGHAPRDEVDRVARIVASGRIRDPRVARRTARVVDGAGVPRGEVVRG